ncbi:YlzJ-like family protein [[Clostridium] leptum]|nr:YlzJ-like family protein [[Clostridium] leptum]
MFYSIVPAEVILGLQDMEKREIIETQAGFVEAVQTPDGPAVSRLISTDPKSYLDPRYAPGSPLDGVPIGVGRKERV